MSREQEDAVEQLALTYGRLAVRGGFADHHIDVTAPNGQCWNVNENGIPQLAKPNHSIRWAS